MTSPTTGARKNPVAKFCRRFNRARKFIDRKKQAKKTGLYMKSDMHYRDGDNTWRIVI
jgi:hypothetical protein